MDRFDWLEVTESSQPPAGAATLQERPSDAGSFYQAGLEMRRAGHFGAAVEYFGRAVGLDVFLYPAWLRLIDTLVRAERLDLAEQRATEAFNRFRDYQPFNASVALVLAHRKIFDTATTYAETAVKSGQETAYGRCVQAECLLRMDKGNRVRARDLIEDAATQTDDAGECYFLGGWMFLDAAWPALAASFFAEAAHRNPRAPLHWFCLADCFRELRLYDQALFYYERVIELEPSHDLARRRANLCKPRLFGLMRAFDRRRLRASWKEQFAKHFPNP